MSTDHPIGRRDAIRAVAALGASLLLAGCAREGEATIHAASGRKIHSPERLLAFREKSKTFAPRRRRR
jgi:hypothetical protein